MYTIEDLSFALIREYLTRKRLLKSLEIFTNECGGEFNITSRVELAKSLTVSKLISKNASVKYDTVLEALISKIVTKSQMFGELNSTSQEETLKIGNENKIKKISTPSNDNRDSEVLTLSNEHDIFKKKEKTIPKNPITSKTQQLKVEDISNEEAIVSNISKTHQTKYSTKDKYKYQRFDQIEIQRLIFGKPKQFPEEWKAGFLWSDYIDYGLKQLKGGPCGLLAVVQAYLIKYIDFENVKTSRQQALYKALIDILEKVGHGKIVIYT
jgi:hypothetical protein